MIDDTHFLRHPLRRGPKATELGEGGMACAYHQGRVVFSNAKVPVLCTLGGPAACGNGGGITEPPDPSSDVA